MQLFYVTAGVTSSIFLTYRTTAKLEYADGSTVKGRSDGNVGFIPVNFAGVLGFGLDFPVGDRLDMKIEPIIRHSITPIVSGEIKEYPYSLGANFGLFFRL